MFRLQCTSLGCDNVTSCWEDPLSWYTDSWDTEVSFSLAWQKGVFPLMFPPPVERIDGEWQWFYLFVPHHLILCLVICGSGCCYWSMCSPGDQPEHKSPLLSLMGVAGHQLALPAAPAPHLLYCLLHLLADSAEKSKWITLINNSFIIL